MLEVRDLHVAFGPIQALSGVDIELRSGEIVAVVGPNGAGKSTLLKAISSLVEIERGEIRLDGQVLNGLSAVEIVRRGVVQCPEGRGLFAVLTVEENLRMGAQRRGEPWTRLKSEVDALADVFPILRSRLHEKAGRLSGGEQQMVALARAVIAKPRVLLLDEPGLGLSPRMMSEVFGLLPRLLGDIEAILIAEQQADAALAIAGRGYVLANSQVVESNIASEIRRNMLTFDRK